MPKKSLFRPYKEAVGEYLPPSFHIEADGRGKSVSVTVFGVRGVRELSDKEILLVTAGETVTLFGELLAVTVLEAKRIRVSGVVSSIAFSKRKRGGRI